MSKDLTAALDELQLGVGPDVPGVLDAAFEVAVAVAGEAGGITDAEVVALQRAFGPRTSGDWSNPLTVRRVANATSGIDSAHRLLSRLAPDRPATAWRANVALLGVAHAAAAADPTLARREADRIDAIRSSLAATLSEHGIDPADPPTEDVPAAPVVDEGPREIDSERFEAALARLDALVGLDSVKVEVRRVADRAYVDRLRQEQGLKVSSATRHLVFTGNPGTGKTTVARILVEVYAALGLLPTGQLVEAGRADLVAGFVGQTAARTRALFQTAIGGMLFVDEAYSLVSGGENDFGREAVDTLVAEMENHRDTTMVVVAGYPAEMDDLLAANAGLASRFPKTIHFPDYTTAELVAIGRLMAGSQDYELTEAAEEALGQWLDSVPRSRGFGNGRLIRNALDVCYDAQAQRLMAAGLGRELPAEAAQLRRIEMVDVSTDALAPLLDALEPGPPPVSGGARAATAAE